MDLGAVGQWPVVVGAYVAKDLLLALPKESEFDECMHHTLYKRKFTELENTELDDKKRRMNHLRRILVKVRPISRLFLARREIRQIYPPCQLLVLARGLATKSGDSLLSDEAYLKELERELASDKPMAIEKRLAGDKSVFILQLKMQYKSKARQSTTAQLQLEESISLVDTLRNWRIAETHIVSTKNSSTHEIFGSGNQELLSKKIAASGANCLFVVIDRLTNGQIEALQRTLLGNSTKIQIYDRYKIVLEIFKQNAHSSIAKLQIALAEIPYMRYKYESHDLYRTIEAKIKRELESKLKTRSVMNEQRRVKKIPTIAVFGYTNAGKTSLIKALTNDAKMKPENKLFATLDITYHGTSLSGSNQSLIFIDTIGFISDIPHTLVEAFKTTINDALEADLYVHLIDISHPDREAQENTVVNILTELAPEDKVKNMIKIYNKCDRIAVPKPNRTAAGHEEFYVSCQDGHGLSDVMETIEKNIYKIMGFLELSLMIEQGSPAMAFLYKNAIVQETSVNQDDEQFVVMRVLLNKLNAIKFVKEFPNVKINKP